MVVVVLDVNLLVAGLWGEVGLLRRAQGGDPGCQEA